MSSSVIPFFPEITDTVLLQTQGRNWVHLASCFLWTGGSGCGLAMTGEMLTWAPHRGCIKREPGVGTSTRNLPGKAGRGNRGWKVLWDRWDIKQEIANLQHGKVWERASWEGKCEKSEAFWGLKERSDEVDEEETVGHFWYREEKTWLESPQSRKAFSGQLI